MPTKNVQDLHRLLQILTIVQTRHDLGPDTLARELGVTKRTIYRDIDKLKASGVPIDFDRNVGGYLIEGEFFLQPLQLTPQEALALAAVCEHVARTEQIPFLRPAARALEKIRAQLPPAMESELAEISDHMVIQTAPATPSEGHGDVYERIRSAIAHRISLECKYESRSRGTGETPSFVFEPYALYYGVRAWYAIGRHGGHDQIRCLKLKRFAEMKETGLKYRIPASFSVRGYLRNAWAMIPGDTDYSVELKLETGIAEVVSDTLWHPTQEIETHADGSATFRCTVSGLDEIVWWVLSLGPSCRVMHPKALADRVRDLALKTGGMYAGESGETKQREGAARTPKRK